MMRNWGDLEVNSKDKNENKFERLWGNIWVGFETNRQTTEFERLTNKTEGIFKGMRGRNGTKDDKNTKKNYWHANKQQKNFVGETRQIIEFNSA